MFALFSKRFISTMLSLVLILALFATAWLFPSIGIILVMGFLLFGLFTTSYMIVKKYREACLQGKIPLATGIRNICFEITGILLSMGLAGLLGRYLAVIATGHMSNDLTRLVAGVVIGLLVGTLVGVIMKRASNHLVKTSPGE